MERNLAKAEKIAYKAEYHRNYGRERINAALAQAKKDAAERARERYNKPKRRFGGASMGNLKGLGTIDLDLPNMRLVGSSKKKRKADPFDFI